MDRILFKRGELVQVLSIKENQGSYYQSGKVYRVEVDYEDFVYLEGPNDICFYPDQLKRV